VISQEQIKSEVFPKLKRLINRSELNLDLLVEVFGNSNTDTSVFAEEITLDLLKEHYFSDSSS
jgi:hypothetical protein